MTAAARFTPRPPAASSYAPAVRISAVNAASSSAVDWSAAGHSFPSPRTHHRTVSRARGDGTRGACREVDPGDASETDAPEAAAATLCSAAICASGIQLDSPSAHSSVSAVIDPACESAGEGARGNGTVHSPRVSASLAYTVTAQRCSRTRRACSDQPVGLPTNLSTRRLRRAPGDCRRYQGSTSPSPSCVLRFLPKSRYESISRHIESGRAGRAPVTQSDRVCDDSARAVDAGWQPHRGCCRRGVRGKRAWAWP